MLSDADLIVRLVMAGLLAGAVGLERELTDQPAGFRTHILVGLGACLFALLSAYGFRSVGIAGAGSHVDVTRIAAQIVTGIGFIGAGVIFKSGSNIRGLTTAATLWTTAAIGTAAGMGALMLAAATTGVTIIALVGLRPLRRLLRKRTPDHKEFVVEGDGGLEIGPLVSLTAKSHVTVDAVTITGENGTRSVRMVLRIPPQVPAEQVAEDLTHAPNVTSVDWSTQ